MIKAPIALIQAINATVAGVETAPQDEYYRRIVSADLPVVYTLIGTGTLTGTAELALTKQVYRILCYVDSTKAGILDDPTQMAHQMLADFLDTWMALINEDGDETLDDGSEIETSGTRIQIDRSVPIRHTGVRHDMTWLPEVYYVGFEIMLPMLIHSGTEVFE